MALCWRALYCAGVVRRAEAVLWLHREMPTTPRNCYRTYAGGVISRGNACFSSVRCCTGRIGHPKQRHSFRTTTTTTSSHTLLFHSDFPVRPARTVFGCHLPSPRPVTLGKRTMLLGGNPHWSGKKRKPSTFTVHVHVHVHYLL